ncbi:cysteine methyltransferase [Sphingomonas sp. Leaf33]|uniref:methylated-DNA--[protein]-cysteine S-methyltransferase n=1 Tax=Sphingomonas sp. Leaf33 TaxID=1736215 RepID=UPI0006FAC32D|nr:methylated-DNA--[protein]-cysteine S-methyltransferase [Sphingomonas sp. Leaf33]KQN19363.1 cysteine methyltransferase [Sphingomonas sp. Leaf33]
MPLYSTTLPSPVGTLTLIASDVGLAAVLWEDDRPGRVALTDVTESADHPILIAAGQQLTEYFAGTRDRFDLPLDPRGTPFQLQVWAALGTIPYGETRSYAQIAAQIGRPTAARAVGATNGRNPVSIVTPCHRVVGTNGTLTGFAGGLSAKNYLLTLERGATTPSMPDPASALDR